jgi:hypothetical protein
MKDPTQPLRSEIFQPGTFGISCQLHGMLNCPHCNPARNVPWVWGPNWSPQDSQPPPSSQPPLPPEKQK